MSRTYRRKKDTRDDYRWVLRDYVFDDHIGSTRRIKIDKNSKEGKKRLAVYHSDSKQTMGPAPHWYCNIFEHSHRQEVRRQIHNYLRNPEDLTNNRGFMVMINENQRHCASWSWW